MSLLMFVVLYIVARGFPASSESTIATTLITPRNTNVPDTGDSTTTPRNNVGDVTTLRSIKRPTIGTILAHPTTESITVTKGQGQPQGQMLDRLPSPFNVSSKYFSDLTTQIVASESEYCGATCSLIYQYKRYRKRRNCGICRCDVLCVTYGDCCPDAVLLIGKFPENRGFQCTKVTPNTDDFDSVFLYTIGTCKFTENRETSEKCLNATSNGWDVLLPVVDDATGFAYRNRYCATCNRVSNYSNWETQIKCSGKEERISIAKSAAETYNIAMNSTRCRIRFKYPKLEDGEAYSRPCKQQSGDIISTCNVTGKWQTFDKTIDLACGMFTHVVHGKYKNVYCYMCNQAYSWDYLLNERDSADKFVVDGVALTALLDFDNSVVVRTSIDEERRNLTVEEYTSGLRCDKTMIFDPLFVKCRAVLCSQGTRYDGNSCVDVVMATNMYTYTVCLHLHVQIPTTMISMDELKRIFWGAVFSPLEGINRTFSHLFWNGAKAIPFLWQNCTSGPNSYVIYHVTFSLFSTFPVKLTEVVRPMEAVVLSAFDVVAALYNVTVHFSQKCVDNQDEASLYCTSDTRLPLYMTMGRIPWNAKDVLRDSQDRLYNRQMTCPYIRLHQNEFKYTLAKNSNIAMKYVFPNASFVDHSFDGYKSEFYDLMLNDAGDVVSRDQFHIWNASAIICLDDYIKLFKSKSTPLGQKDSYLAILSVVCTCISLLFLIITFSIYCVSSSLRTTSGVTNMCLVVTLFVTQVLYEFGMEQTTVQTVCVVIGVLIHMLWLSVIFWMNACTVQLFLKLSFPFQWRAGSFRKILLISALYSFAIPTVIVSANVLINFYTEDSIGYGGRVCYISTAMGRRYAFGVPIGVVTLANISLYMFTICRMRSQYTSIQKSKESKINMLSCVKLSSITGISWLFGYVYEATKLQVFAYIFTVMVGGQGVLLFLVFVNNHVSRLCTARKHKFDSSSGISRSINSANTTASTASSHL